jgi:GNAT superfamily N-acetyltransferase
MDEDLERMSREQLVSEVRKLRQGIRVHRDSTGHDLCWHQPALWGLLPETTDPVPEVPDWPQFLQGCLRYRQSLDEQAPRAPRTNAAYGGEEPSVRTLAPHEVALHRELRLRALRDAPESFGESLAEVLARPASYWEELTRSVTEPGPHVMFLACARERVVGSAYGLVDPERERAGRVGGMWVEPAARRRGVARALLQAVLAWARERGFGRVALWAPADSPAALSLYRQAGFRDTGRRRPLPSDPSREVLELETTP